VERAAILPTHGLAGVQPDPHRIALVAVDGERHADLYSDPVDLGTQSNLIGAPGPVNDGPITADQVGGSRPLPTGHGNRVDGFHARHRRPLMDGKTSGVNSWQLLLGVMPVP
jgi:hypothetical protein